MNTRLSRPKVAGSVIALVLLLGAGLAMAQRPIPATEPGAAPPSATSAPSTGQPDGAIQQRGQQGAGPAFTDGQGAAPRPGQSPAGSAPDDNPTVAGGASRQATQPFFSYYQVAGATLRGRDSTTAFAYDGLGCTHTTSGGDILNTELHIPDGSLIKYLRIYFIDTSTTGSVRGFLTRYTPGQNTSDLVFADLGVAAAPGWGFVVSSELNETVDNSAYAYTLIGWPSAAGTTLQVCGVRIAYYAPATGGVYVPLVKKDPAGP
ncbi:MAG: hypothetical protein IPO81_26825 [Kouleothrix sp.]|nr:hypothetical protein [Kouleothrix sp.]